MYHTEPLLAEVFGEAFKAGVVYLPLHLPAMFGENRRLVYCELVPLGK
jgi:hypothetical protein